VYQDDQGRPYTNETAQEGFGYDPIFVPEGLTKTFAELSLAEKNQIAHRARALQKFKKFVLDDQIFEGH
jgi:XTP/dITP diphosphohydrolase